MYEHSIVNFMGEIIVFGGQTQIDNAFDEMYKLNCMDSDLQNCKWIKMEQKLLEARSAMSALLIPDEGFC